MPMLKELWIDFGANKHHRYISALGIAKALSKEKAEAFAFFVIPSQDVILFCLLMEQEKESLGNLKSCTFFNKGISRISKLSGSFKFRNG